MRGGMHLKARDSDWWIRFRTSMENREGQVHIRRRLPHSRYDFDM